MNHEMPDVSGERMRVSPADVAVHGPTSALILSVVRYGVDFPKVEGYSIIGLKRILRYTGLSEEDARTELYRLHFRKVLLVRRFPEGTGYKFAPPVAVRESEGTVKPPEPVRPVSDWTERFVQQAERTIGEMQDMTYDGRVFVQLHADDPAEGWPSVSRRFPFADIERGLLALPGEMTHWSKWTQPEGGRVLEYGRIAEDGELITDHTNEGDSDATN